MTTRRARVRLGKSKSTIYRLVKEGVLRAKYSGARLIIDDVSVAEYERSQPERLAKATNADDLRDAVRLLGDVQAILRQVARRLTK